jgi:hypothetical protein
MMLPLLVSRRFQVLFHSPHRGAFHLSLTVLVHYRSLSSIQPWKMVLPNSRRVPRVPRYLGRRPGKNHTFRLRDYHPLWHDFPDSSAIYDFGNFPESPKPFPVRPLNPGYTTLSGLHISGLGCSRSARRYSGNLS